MTEHPRDRPVLAIDIGGTKLAAGLVSADGELVWRTSAPTPSDVGADGLLEAVVDVARSAIDAADVRPTRCVVGCPGPGRRRYELVSPINLAAWRDFPLRRRLADALDLDVAIDNDARALALAEGWVGAADGVDDYVALVVSTGIGGGIVLGGRLVGGADGNAGHLGQMIAEPDGPADRAGVPGSLEGSWSGTGILRRTGRAPRDADDVERRACGTAVGRVLASIANLLDLRLAVVSGSVALGYGEAFFDAAQAELDLRCRTTYTRGARVVPGRLGDEGPLIGAAAVALHARRSAP